MTTKNKPIPIIGFEVHVELSTNSKMFCGCPAEHFAKTPNSQTCPVCLGLPGALPVPNQKAIEDTIKIGLALNCQINKESKFDRKHYSYPDLPKGYQISQYDLPLCYQGQLTLDSGKKIRIKRIHLEEDTGKLQHKKLDSEDVSLVDFNRSGVPLVEIVSEPDIASSEEAKEYLKKIHQLMRTLKVSNADMEKGSMRLEANISVGDPKNLPDYKVEVKNVNSFRFIANAIDYEIERQKELLQKGQIPSQQTRGWSQKQRKTVVQRQKEAEADYRYFPEPDIPPLVIAAELIDAIGASLPQLPSQIRQELLKLGIQKRYADLLLKNKTAIKLLKELSLDNQIEADKLANFLVNKKIDSNLDAKTAKDSYLQLTTSSINDESALGELVEKVLKNHSKAVADYHKNPKSIGFLIGQLMQQTKGQADPQIVRKILLEKLTKRQ